MCCVARRPSGGCDLLGVEEASKGSFASRLSKELPLQAVALLLLLLLLARRRVGGASEKLNTA